MVLGFKILLTKFGYIWKEGDEGGTVEAGKSRGGTLSTQDTVISGEESVMLSCALSPS